MAALRPTELETLAVFQDRRRVGLLERIPNGSRFSYDPKVLEEGGEAIASHLPLLRQPFVTPGVNLHPFFAGLLPEGLRLSALTRRLKTSSDDLFSLLAAVGGDCIGDVAVAEPGEDLVLRDALVDARRPEELDFRAILQSTLDPEAETLDLSIPGVQEKISGSMISLPLRSNSRNAAFILKLDPPDRPKLVENEAFFMKAARSCGLSTADCKLIQDGRGVSGLLVTRFDRVFEKGERTPRKLHQEDGCQLLNRYPADKYQVTAAEIMEALEDQATAPIVEKQRFLELYAFSYLIGNGDLHAKNVSLLRSPEGITTLSPAYDLLSTQAYRRLDQRMAMKLGAKDDDFQALDFIRFGERFGVREPATRKMLQRLGNRIHAFADQVDEIGLPEADELRIRRCIETRVERLSS